MKLLTKKERNILINKLFDFQEVQFKNPFILGKKNKLKLASDAFLQILISFFERGLFDIRFVELYLDLGQGEECLVVKKRGYNWVCRITFSTTYIFFDFPSEGGYLNEFTRSLYGYTGGDEIVEITFKSLSDFHRNFIKSRSLSAFILSTCRQTPVVFDGVSYDFSSKKMLIKSL